MLNPILILLIHLEWPVWAKSNMAATGKNVFFIPVDCNPIKSCNTTFSRFEGILNPILILLIHLEWPAWAKFNMAATVKNVFLFQLTVTPQSHVIPLFTGL